MKPKNPLISTALDLFNKTNLNIIPCRNKAPLITWKEFQSKRLLKIQLEDLLSRNPDAGLGLICGFDGVIAIDIDAKFDGDFPPYIPETNFAKQVFEQVGGVLTPPICILLKLLDAFDDSFPNLYIERTPNFGFHIIFRVENPPSKMKLANYPNDQVAVELQGVGCFLVVAPTSGYKTINGSLFDLPTIPEDLFAKTLTTAVEIGKHDDGQKVNSEVLDKVVQAAKEFGLIIVNEAPDFIRIKRLGTNNTCSGTIFKNTGGVWLFSPNVPPFNANEYYTPTEFVAKIKFNGNTRKAAEWLGLNTPANPRKSNAFIEAKDFLHSLGSFRMNVVNKFIEFKANNDSAWKPLTDIDIDKVFTQIREANITIAKDNLFSLMRTLAAEQQFHPFREYFENLPPATGDPLKDFSELIKTEQEFQPLVYKFLLTFFVSAVAQSLGDRGSDVMLVLYGPQGSGKTTLLRHLVPKELSDYYTEISLFLIDKDLQIASATSFILNLDDLETLQFKSMGFLKSLLSSSYVYYRPPYGRSLERHWRFATFVGSVNNKEFLKDDSGYRRFLVIPLLKRNPNLLDFDMDKIWSQAYQIYKSKGVINIDEAGIETLNSINSRFEIFDETAELVRLVFQNPTTPDGAVFLTRAQIVNILKNAFPRININAKSVSAALRKIGIEPVHTKRGNFYKLQIVEEYTQYVQEMFPTTSGGSVADF
jgi:GTPase SAR1 family protein